MVGETRRYPARMPRRLTPILLALAAALLSACAGMYVAGDAGPNRGDAEARAPR